MRFREFHDSEFPGSEVLRASSDVLDRADLTEVGDPLECLSREARLVYLLLGLSAQINNGGFDQFFFNFEGAYADEMHRHLESIGAVECAVVLKSAMSHFPNGKVPADDDERATVLIKITQNPDVVSHFGELEKEFWGLDTALCERIDTYVRANPEATIEA